MKTNKMMKIASALLALMMVVLCLTACGEKSVTLTVNDMGTKTEVEAKTGMKVSDVLAEAGVTLGDKDETVPAADSAIAEDTTEIVVKRFVKVTVVKDGEEKAVELVGGTVADAVKAAGITLADNEMTDVDSKDYLKNGMTINIVKEMKVTLTADGKTQDVTTKAATVGAFLEEQGITLGDDDEVSEKSETKIAEGMKIVVKRVEYKEEKKTEKVPFSTKEEYSDSMSEGESQVTQQGVDGEKEVTYKVKYVDGKEDSRTVVSEKVTKEAVDEIVTYGTASSGDGGDGGVYEVSREVYYDCDGSGHGYIDITYSDGHHEYPTF